MHSLSAVTRLLPGILGPLAWVTLSAGIAILTVQVWRRRNLPSTVRMSVVVIASVLLNLHLTVYDLTVLAAPLLWLSGWIQDEGDRDTAVRSGQWWSMLYLFYLTLLFPTARLVAVQVSVLVMVWFVYEVNRVATRPAVAAELAR